MGPLPPGHRIGLRQLDASVEGYDDTLVTLLGDVATNYVQMRSSRAHRIRPGERAIAARDAADHRARFQGGTTSQLDVYQARSTLEQTQAQISEFEISLRQTTNLLCILLGIPPEELQGKLGPAPIPTAPPEVAIGIPADLLRRRPDIRRAERLAAAQSAQIGVAEADFYPAISINGTIGGVAERFPDLFRSTALNGNVGPSFQWNILNYGRIRNNVRLQDAKFQEAVAAYQQTVLGAAREVENGLVTFLRAQQRTKYQTASVNDAEQAVKIVLAQYRAGAVDFTRVSQLEQALVQQQDVLTQARGEIAAGLIQVYKALGGGWQIRCTGCELGLLPGQGGARPRRPRSCPLRGPSRRPDWRSRRRGTPSSRVSWPNASLLTQSPDSGNREISCGSLSPLGKLTFPYFEAKMGDNSRKPCDATVRAGTNHVDSICLSELQQAASGLC